VPPFLPRTLRYVSYDRARAAPPPLDAPPHAILRFSIAPESFSAKRRVWLLAVPVGSSGISRTPIALAVRHLPSDLSGHVELAFDLSPAFALAAEADASVVIRMEVLARSCSDSGTVPFVALVAELQVMERGRTASAGWIVDQDEVMKLEPPSPSFQAPAVGVLAADAPFLESILENSIAFRDMPLPATQASALSSGGRPYLPACHDGDRVADNVHSGTSSIEPTLVPVHVYLQSPFESIEGAFVSHFIAAAYHRGEYSAKTLQIYSSLSPQAQSPGLELSLPFASIARTDFVCPLCLRNCHRSGTLRMHLGVEHPALDVSCQLIPISADANLTSLAGKGALALSNNWQARRPRLVRLFCLAPWQSIFYSGIDTDAATDVVQSRGRARHLSAIANDKNDVKSRARQHRRRTRGSSQVQWERAGSMAAAGTSKKPTMRPGPGLLACDDEEYVDNLTVLTAHKPRFPGWSSEAELSGASLCAAMEKLGIMNNIRKSRRGRVGAVAKQAIVACEVREPTSVHCTSEDQELGGDDTDSEYNEHETDKTGIVRIEWARCDECDKHFVHRANRTMFCSVECEAVHKAIGARLKKSRVVSKVKKVCSSSSDSVKSWSMIAPLAPLPVKVNQHNDLAFKKSLEHLTLFHIVSVAKFEYFHVSKNDEDSEEEVDHSWRLQISEEDIMRLDVKPKHKILWTMWNRFAFAKCAAGQYAERYTRFSLELFALEYGGEVNRLGLRAELASFARALHVHGCLDGAAVLSVMHCLDGRKSHVDCIESRTPKGKCCETRHEVDEDAAVDVECAGGVWYGTTSGDGVFKKKTKGRAYKGWSNKSKGRKKRRH
jgi:hypothetical protein